MIHRSTVLGIGGPGRGLVLLAGVLLACLPRSAAAQAAAGKPPPVEQRIYAFQHRILPRWTHGSKGAFYEDLRAGRTERLIAAAKELVGEDYARGITVKPVPGADQVLLVFPAPETVPHCYCALVIKTGNAYRYVTLERTFPFEGSDAKSVVGEWTSDAHLNFGGRAYTDAESFMKEFAPGPAKDPPPEPEAATRVPSAVPAAP